jgi:hypothetical protein
VPVTVSVTGGTITSRARGVSNINVRPK